MFKKLGLILFLVVAIALPGCTPKPAERSSLKLGAIPLIINLPAYVAQKEGLFDEQNITVEIVPLRSTTEQNSALLTGAVDGIFQHIFQTLMLNKDEGTSKIVGASDMPWMFAIIASAGSGITSVAELKHKEIAVATNTVIDYALERLLVHKGLSPADIVKVNVPNMPLRLEMLNQGKVPVAILSSPLSDLAVLTGGRVIVDDRDDPFAGPGLVFTNKALTNKSEAIERFIKAWQQAIDLINANPEKYHGLLNEIANVPEGVSERMKVPTFPHLRLPDRAEIESTVDWMIAKGLTSKRLAYEDIVDARYLR